MTNERVVRLADNTNNSRYVTPEDAVRQVLDDLEAGKFKPTKALMLFITDVDEQDESIKVRWANMDRGDSVFYLSRALHHELHDDWE